MADHEIQLELREILRLGQIDGIQDLLLGLGFVDDIAQPLTAGLGRDGQRLRTALAQGFDQRHRNRVDAHRTDAELGTQLAQANGHLVDLGMIGHRRRDQADPVAVF